MLENIENFISPSTNGSFSGDSGASLPPSEITDASGLSTSTTSGRSVAFVDSSLAKVDDLVSTLTGAAVYRIDAGQNGASYIGSVLAQLQGEGVGVGSVHIFAHGSSGALQLGETTLTADNLTGYSDDLANWSKSQTKDVLIYGCDVAKGATGNAFINQLAILTGADIQSSDDLTGSEALGGDWDLEVMTGQVESGLIVSAAGQSAYQATLASLMITSNDGGNTSAVAVKSGTSYITDVNVTGANGYYEGFGVEYYFSGGTDSYLFNIDVKTGVVSFKSIFDYDRPTDVGRNNIYDINILAVDWTGQSDTQAMAVTVQPVSTPIADPFDIVNSSNISVFEGATAVVDLSVKGAANGFNENYGVEYYFQGGQDSYLFNLNKNTGTLSFKQAPDYEKPDDVNRNNVYDVGIKAIDYTGQSSTRAFEISVKDVVELGSKPVITSNGGQPYALIEIAEGSALATDMAVTDADGQTEGNGITYSIQGGIDRDLFKIDVNTGVLSFKNAPDFESPVDANQDNIYGVDILVTDSTGQRDSQFIDVKVTDVAEVTRPIITSNGGGDTAVIHVNEGSTAVTDVMTSGANGYSEGNGLTYILNVGADAARFDIDAKTGVISFKSVPDFENPTDEDGNNVYFVNVYVQDPTGQADSQFLSIVVNNIVEGGTPPVITSSGGGDSAFIKVKENNTFAVDVQSTDAEGDTEGKGITYRINAGEDAQLFNIDSKTGVISFRSAPDFEAPADHDLNNVYRLNVLATDSAGQVDSQFIQIQITNEVSVYLLGGQSNMAGDTSNAHFLAGTPKANPLPAVQIWQPGINAFVNLRPGFNNNFGVGSGFGAELGFGHAIAAARANGSLKGEEIYLVKYAIGATSLAVDWNINGQGNRYDDFTHWVGGALAKLAGAEIGYTVEGMLWMQGENDAIDPTRASNYQRNLDDLIGDVRSRYGATMDFVIGRLHEELTPFFYTQANVVRAAQTHVANSNPNNHLVNTDGFAVNPIDGVHFNSSGHLALGEAFADALIP